MYALLIIDYSPIQGKLKPRFQSLDNSFEAKNMSFILPLSLSSFHLRHHRMVTYGKQIYPFIPHSHAILHLLVLLDFCPLLSPHACLLFEILIQAPLSIVSFCVRDVFNFQLTDGEELLEIQYLYGSTSVLIHNAFIGAFDSYLPFGIQLLAWDHLYII